MKLILCSIVIFFPMYPAVADIGNFDILVFENDGRLVYVSIYSVGILKHGDLCYYNYEGVYQGEVSEYFHEAYSNVDSVDVYNEVVYLNMLNIDTTYDEDTLYMLKTEQRISLKDFSEFKLIDAFNGNTYGYTYTESLEQVDNIWIENYEIEKLFSFSDNELCEMDLYGIKGNWSKNQILELEEEIVQIIKLQDVKLFYSKLEEFHERFLIMIGFCSC